jgi:hypothetical protein
LAAGLGEVAAHCFAGRAGHTVAHSRVVAAAQAECLAVPGDAVQTFAGGALAAVADVTAGTAVVGIVLEILAGIGSGAAQSLGAGAGADGGGSSGGGGDRDGGSDGRGSRNSGEDSLGQLSCRGEEHSFSDENGLGESSGSGDMGSGGGKTQAAAGGVDLITAVADLDGGRSSLTRWDRCGCGCGCRRRRVDGRGHAVDRGASNLAGVVN